MKQKGKLIAAMGLPGSGKSAILPRVARQCKADCFCEPEESEWPDAVRMKDRVGHITTMTWFRSIRAPLLYKADRLRKDGRLVFVDSYYDKLTAALLGKPGMEWLISPSDKYYPIISDLSRVDYEELPDADALVSFQVPEQQWCELLDKRGRVFDKKTSIRETFHTQGRFLDAAAEYCRQREIPHMVFENEMAGLDSAAESLFRQLKGAGVV